MGQREHLGGDMLAWSMKPSTLLETGSLFAADLGALEDPCGSTSQVATEALELPRCQAIWFTWVLGIRTQVLTLTCYFIH